MATWSVFALVLCVLWAHDGAMYLDIQVAMDTTDPHAQARFWAAVLGCEVEDHADLVDELVASGRLPADDRIVIAGRSAFRDVAAVRDPTGRRPRLFFQLVPESKTVKNRVHLDIAVGEAGVDAERARVEALGATWLWTTADRGPVTHTMADPEGNEFCLH